MFSIVITFLTGTCVTLVQSDKQFFFSLHNQIWITVWAWQVKGGQYILVILDHYFKQSPEINLKLTWNTNPFQRTAMNIFLSFFHVAAHRWCSGESVLFCNTCKFWDTLQWSYCVYSNTPLNALQIRSAWTGRPSSIHCWSFSNPTFQSHAKWIYHSRSLALVLIPNVQLYHTSALFFCHNRCIKQFVLSSMCHPHSLQKIKFYAGPDLCASK